MKTIGLLGGMTWRASAAYYERINAEVERRVGPFHSADVLLRSIDYSELRRCRVDNDWRRLGRLLARACRGLQAAGAEGILICSNTIHKFVPQLESQVGVPFLHVADALAERARAEGVECLALFGTAFTVRERFYVERLESHGLRVVVSPPERVEAMNRVLLEELAQGVVLPASRQVFVDAMRELQREGAQVMAQACTEISLLVGPGDVDVPVYDTVRVHADAAVTWALA